MDKILDRLGLFDLIAVFLPGSIATSLTLIFDQIVFDFGISKYVSTEDVVVFVIVSYFIGMILQELGSLTYKYLINKQNAILLRSMDTTRKNSSLTAAEKEAVQAIVRKELRLSEIPDDNQLFHYCRYSGGSSAHTDKEQSLAAMSLNLSLYFFFLSILVVFWTFSHKVASLGAVAVSLILIGILLFYRSIRYYSVRFVRVVRTFYYTYTKEHK